MKKRILSALSAAAVSLSVLTASMPVSASIYCGPSDSLTSEYFFDIQFTGSPLAEYEYAQENGVNEFIFTDEGIEAYAGLMKEHSEKISDIESFLGHKVVKNYDYTAILDGISLSEITDEDFIKLKENSGELGIKSISAHSELIVDAKSAAKADKKEYTSSDLTDVMFANTGIDSSGLKGDSTVIAVIDGNFDIEHEYITSMPENAEGRIDTDYIEKIAPYLNIQAKDSENLYFNEKVPFRYNYTDNNTEVWVEENEDVHGTHVAGIAGGNGDAVTSEEYSPRGAAPDAQLLLMAIGRGENYMSSHCELAALNDCAYLGVDIINTSFGGPYLPITEAAVLSEAIGNLEKLGIIYCTAFGNEAKIDFGEDSLINTGYSSSGIGDGISSAFTVGSTDNPIIRGSVISAGGEKFAFCESKIDAYDEDRLFEEAFAGEETEYVMIPGIGYPEDFEGIDVNGKIAVVNRGELSFEEKAQIAMDNGAVGIIFVNKDNSIINPACSLLPSALITADDGEKLAQLEDKKLTVLTDVITEKITGDISDYSNFGPNEYLVIKPEITGYGGNIISSVPGENSYDKLSGTSMSAPQISGIAALLKGYLKENKEKYGIKVSADYSRLIECLLMSTAQPVYDNDNIYIASPRVQGSGLVNVKNAVDTPAYLYTDSEVDFNRPKLSLGDSLEKNIGTKEFGSDKFYFHIKNISDKPVTYSLSYDLMRDDVDAYGMLAWGSAPLKDSRVIFSVSGKETDSVTVAPKEDVIVNLDMEISDEEKEFINEYFTKGTFIDGYVHLESQDAPTLSLPFSGYYGSWSDPSILADFIYNEYKPKYASILSDSYGNIAGVNGIASLNGEDVIIGKLPAFSPNGDGVFDEVTANICFNKKCQNVDIELYKGSELVQSDHIDYSKVLFQNCGSNYDLKGAENGDVYTVKITADTLTVNNDKRTETITTDFTIDTIAPEIKEVRTIEIYGEKNLLLKVSDNYAVQGGVISDGEPESEEHFEDMSYSYDMDSDDVYLVFALPEDTKDCNVDIYDMAGNMITKSADELLEESKGGYTMEAGMLFSTDDASFGENIKLTDENGKELPLTFSSTPAEAFENGDEFAEIRLNGCEYFNMPVFVGISGDADLNYEVDLYDAIYVARYIIWSHSQNDDESEFVGFEGSLGGYLADCDKNGKIDLYDAIGIAKLLLKAPKV